MKRILGIDYGARRIGIAVSDPLRIIAQGITVVENSPELHDHLRQLIKEYNIEKIVVGMPLSLKGEQGSQAGKVEQFIAQLKNNFGLEVIEIDERFTSRIAQQTIRSLGVSKKRRQMKEKVDQIAAALILQDYLDKQKGSKIEFSGC
ncbi:MAG TPA: Holliday junction resolvase RuvX [Bacteroidota bacterium]|nr:Holliday junction resolvase RuvX [Bacteroidota bacterium]